MLSNDNPGCDLFILLLSRNRRGGSHGVDVEDLYAVGDDGGSGAGLVLECVGRVRGNRDWHRHRHRDHAAWRAAGLDHERGGFVDQGGAVALHDCRDVARRRAGNINSPVGQLGHRLRGKRDLVARVDHPAARYHLRVNNLHLLLLCFHHRRRGRRAGRRVDELLLFAHLRGTAVRDLLRLRLRGRRTDCRAVSDPAADHVVVLLARLRLLAGRARR